MKKKQRKVLWEELGGKVVLEENKGKEELKPYCEESQKLVDVKRNVERVRFVASKWLKKELDSNPETKGFRGTVMCLLDGVLYKLRVQRRLSCYWRKKRLKDPKFKELKALYRQEDKMKKRIKKLEELMAKKHPKCVQTDFLMSFLSKSGAKKKGNKRKEAKEN